MWEFIVIRPTDQQSNSSEPLVRQLVNNHKNLFQEQNCPHVSQGCLMLTTMSTDGLGYIQLWQTGNFISLIVIKIFIIQIYILTCLPQLCRPGPDGSKLMTPLVNVSLKFQMLISNICQYFLLKKCEKLLQCKSCWKNERSFCSAKASLIFSTKNFAVQKLLSFFQQKFQCFWL